MGMLPRTFHSVITIIQYHHHHHHRRRQHYHHNFFINIIHHYPTYQDHDSVDVGLGEYIRKDTTAPWLATYRLLSKSTPCIPEVAIRLAGLSEFEHSYAQVIMYPPQPAAVLDLEGRQKNFTCRMYGAYLQEMRDRNSAGAAVAESFLVWHRDRLWDPVCGGVRQRSTHRGITVSGTCVVACRYWYELHDGYWGQFMLTQVPHRSAHDLLPVEHKGQYLECMCNFAGMLQYLMSWRWAEPGIVVSDSGCRFRTESLPLIPGRDAPQEPATACIITVQQ